MQLTIRVDPELARNVKRAAERAGKSVNRWVADTLSAILDPATATDEGERLKERLRRAGLLSEPSPTTTRRPSSAALASARKAAGQGTDLSSLIGEDRR